MTALRWQARCRGVSKIYRCLRAHIVRLLNIPLFFNLMKRLLAAVKKALASALDQ